VPYQALADAVLLLHFGFVLFVVLGLLAIVLGHRRAWTWVDRLGFRLAHLAAIGFVVTQAWLGQACPLTTLESWLRTRGGGTPYAQGFIAHWVQRLVFWDAPPWLFTLLYTAFGALVAWTWWRWPPRRMR
jgi:hypothetical protein